MINSFEKYLFLTALILIVISNNSFSQADAPGISAHLDSLLASRSYDDLENYALRTLMLSDSLEIMEKAALHKYLGIVYIIKGREQDGRWQFTQWLKLDPAGYIDRFNYPPMIVRAYNEVKSEIVRSREFIVYESVERWKPSTSDIFKSVLLPGWGQIEQGKTARGITFLVIQSGSVAAWFISDHNLTLANNAYQRETDPAKFDKLYDKTNNWNYARWAFTFTGIATYVLAQADFFFLPPEINLSAYPSTNQDKMASLNQIDSNHIVNLTLLKISL